MSQFIYLFRRKIARTNTEQSTDKEIEHSRHTVFLCLLTDGGINFVFYPLSNLLPHYFHQLPFYPHSFGRDNDALAAIAIACLFLLVGHRRRRCRSCIRYTGAESLTLSFINHRNTEKEPLFAAYSNRHIPQRQPHRFRTLFQPQRFLIFIRR